MRAPVWTHQGLHHDVLQSKAYFFDAGPSSLREKPVVRVLPWPTGQLHSRTPGQTPGTRAPPDQDGLGGFRQDWLQSQVRGQTARCSVTHTDVPRAARQAPRSESITGTSQPSRQACRICSFVHHKNIYVCVYLLPTDVVSTSSTCPLYYYGWLTIEHWHDLLTA